MTKEQEEAIEILEKIDVKFFISGMTEQKDYIIDKADEVNVAIEKVLAMLKEKDNRINQLENMNEFQSKDIKKIVDYTFELNKEIEQQEKIIDLMSEQLTTPIHDKKWIKKYYENKANGGNER